MPASSGSAGPSSGTSRIRTMIVSATIDHAHGSPTLLWKRSRSQREQVLERRERARDDHDRRTARSRVVHSAAAPRVAAQQPPAGLRRALTRPCLRSASIAYCEHDGWYLHWPAPRNSAERVAADRTRAPTPRYLTPRPSRAPRRRARRATRTRALGRLRRAPAARRARSRGPAGPAVEPGAPDLAQLALDPVAHDRVAGRLAAPRARAAARRAPSSRANQ